MLLTINRGLWCSFCRRHIVQLGRIRGPLKQLGIETLAVIARELEPSRLYVRHRPLGVPLAADPDQVTHRAYGVPRPPLTFEFEQAIGKMHVDLQDVAVSRADLAELRAAVQATEADPAAGPDRPIPVWDFIFMQRKLYPYEMSERDQREWARNKALGTGQFLVDREGVVRWSAAQQMTDLPAGLGNYPSETQLLVAARALAR